MPSAKKFKNFSDEDFEWKFDGVNFTFKAGQEVYLEADKAAHFCKHLVDREINRKNSAEGRLHNRQTEVSTRSPVERAPLEALCFPSDEVVSSMEALDRNEKGKRGRGKKVVEEEFADLT